jgi:hypothetical protein
MTRYFFRSEYGIRLTVTFFIPWDALSDERTGLSFVCAAGFASAVFLGRSPEGLPTVFYCLRFETSLFVTSYDSQGHGGGIRPRLHTDVLLATSSLRPRYIAPARTTQKTSLSLLRVLSLQGKHVHRDVSQQRLLCCSLFTQLLHGNGSTCHNMLITLISSMEQRSS